MSTKTHCADGHAGAPIFKRFESRAGKHILIVPHSRIFDLPADLAARFDRHDPDVMALAHALGATAAGEDALNVVPEPAPQSLSLNVSSACNLSCTYCYADRGSFDGHQSKLMSAVVAQEAIERLFTLADPRQPITIGFLGGEPFVNRRLLREVVVYTEDRVRKLNLDVRFSVTTNATLLTDADLDLLRNHRFAVTVSIDGGAAIQDAQRPHINGAGSFEDVRRRISPLLSNPGRAQIAARATVTSSDLNLERKFSAIRAMGFPEVGFAPLRMSPSGGSLTFREWPQYLSALIRVARSELAAPLAGRDIALTNLAIALKQLHRGASAPYPCGAGGGYFSVSADGRWYACHRAVGKPDYELGDSRGLDSAKRRRFLEQRHVDAQIECSACWARYLCSGGCHQEAAARTPASCNFIRQWLEFCLTAYCELLEQCPGYFIPQGSTSNKARFA
jgi:uncharacterized protein